MKKLILLALLLMVSGCSGYNNMTGKQVTPKQTQMQSHSHTAAPTPAITQASSTATPSTGKESITIKEASNEIPWFLLGLIQTPTGNPVYQVPGQHLGIQPPTGNPANQTPIGNPGTKVPSGSTGQAPQTPQAPQAPQGNKDSSQFPQQVLDLVNQARSKAGLNALSMSNELSNVAMVKAQDMYNNNYFDHNSPTHGSPFDMMKEYGISYNSAGENIAKGQATPTQVMNDWMNSPGHKANILNSSFTQIGIAYYNSEWVQMFKG